MKKILKVLVPLIMIGVIGTLYLMGTPSQPPQTITQEKNDEEKGIDFPKTFENMELKQLVSGPEAMKQISKLHGTEIAIKEGYIAIYENQSAQMILWISESAKEEEATMLLDIMDKKMPNSQVFKNYAKKEIDGNLVYYVFGMDMDNYYYQKGAKLYWVALNYPDKDYLIKKIHSKF